MNQEWTCPHCNRIQIATQENFSEEPDYIRMGVAKQGWLIATVVGVRCLNAECNEPTITVIINESIKCPPNTPISDRRGEEVFKVRVHPESSYKPQPSCVPDPLVKDYREACLIRDKSPKASATLARRCLQGMIRDFCGISRARLIDEIKAIRELVDAGNAPAGVAAETMDAIDAVRSIGNIGAHMEKDINIIVDVDPGEAQSLIELIEMLFDEWYVAREKRQKRLKNVIKVATAKKTIIGHASQPQLPAPKP